MHRRIAMFAVVAAVAALAAVPAAIAGKGGGKTDPSITLNQATGFAATQPSLGSYVTFSTVYPTSVQTPRVEVLCSQNGALMYGEAGSPDWAFLLGGGASLWKAAGGPASCVANLYYFSWKAGQPTTVYLATTKFDATG
jgi:hypothetical protein